MKSHRSLTLALLLFATPVAAAESYWSTVFDLKLQVGLKDTVASQPPTNLLGGFVGLPREFSAWTCRAGDIYEHRMHVTTRYLECVSGKATVYTQVSCQTQKADNNSSTIRVQSNRGRIALFTLSCQSFISDPTTVEGPQP
jgi:hypothetical protein